MSDFDAHALIARLRQGDETARREAYLRIFGGDLGRYVLADIAASAGVGQRYAGPADLYALGEHMGAQHLALDILALAAFDEASVVSMVLTDQLEGPTYEPSASPSFADESPDLTDD
ncbi:MAG: hypothetical protein DI570_09205 [Phenylobacterium zucineum]|nr:MAG: hypothetical protein DI570_09205 [Phenylobacterium zucineum]